MITTQKFSANLKAFGKLDDAARALFAETVEYVMFHYHKHGNKTPYNQLVQAAPKGVFGDMIRKIKLGKRDKDMTDSAVESIASMTTAELFADREQKKAEAAAKRAAKADSEKRKTTNVSIEYGLVGNGDCVELSAEEFEAAMQTVMAMRMEAVATMPMLKAA
jgi:4-hydroxy-L-threonine phosphate dehydrogenase PdxA